MLREEKEKKTHKNLHKNKRYHLLKDGEKKKLRKKFLKIFEKPFLYEYTRLVVHFLFEVVQRLPKMALQNFKFSCLPYFAFTHATL